MKKKVYRVLFPVTLAVVMAVFLSTIFFANANPSFAKAVSKNSSVASGTSAVEHTEARIKQLRGALKITEVQEESWKNLTQVMRENAKEMDAFTKDRAGNNETMNAVERMKLHSRITEAHLDQQRKFIPPFEAFYAGMSDEQKKSTDTMFQTGVSGKARRK